jgi:hypothetical protein
VSDRRAGVIASSRLGCRASEWTGSHTMTTRDYSGSTSWSYGRRWTGQLHRTARGGNAVYEPETARLVALPKGRKVDSSLWSKGSREKHGGTCIGRSRQPWVQGALWTRHTQRGPQNRPSFPGRALDPTKRNSSRLEDRSSLANSRVGPTGHSKGSRSSRSIRLVWPELGFRRTGGSIHQPLRFAALKAGSLR